MSRPDSIAAEQRLDRVFRALGDVTRRRLLSRLAQSTATVSELAAPFDMSLAAVGKHIRVLENAGLVERRIDGRIHRCTFRAAPMHEIAVWLDHYSEFWTDTLDALARHVEDNP